MLLYVALAVGVLAFARLLSTRGGSGTPPPAPTGPGATESASASSRELPLRRPPNATAELGVLTDRPEAELAALLDREALAASVTPAICGDPPACDAVRATLRDEHATTLRVDDSSSWDLARDGTSPATGGGSADVRPARRPSPERGRILGDLDAGARGLSAADLARVRKAPRVAVVHVATPASPGALALRTAFAAAAALSAATGGAVWDPLLSRIESARDFAKHSPTEPLGATVFRADRVEVLVQPETADEPAPDRAVVRVLTAGLSRWGAPDVEWRAIPGAAGERAARIVLRVAQAVADGLESGPAVVRRADVAGEPAPDGEAGYAAALPESVAIRLVPASPKIGDASDFLALIVPPGEGVVGSLELVERFFGPFAATAPDPDAARAEAQSAQSRLAGALATWTGSRARGARLLVRLPFPIPGGAGDESMWIDVGSYDATTITGTLLDDPLGATDLARGDRVTRPRTDVERFDLRTSSQQEPP
jgi:hypothetical protein